MTGSFVTLRNFSDSELFFDEPETKEILEFFFPDRRQRIDATTLTSPLRNFAQGLLIEAIDASYSLGDSQMLLSSFYTPSSGMRQALTKAGQKAGKHWFKHASDRDLHNAKVAESVRRQLSWAFSTTLLDLLNEVALGGKGRTLFLAHVQYAAPTEPETLES